MWYAPIGSTEYVKNLHNDFRIKEYLLSEQRHNSLQTDTKSSFVDTTKNTKQKSTGSKQNRTAAVLVKLHRSYVKTEVDLIGYFPRR